MPRAHRRKESAFSPLLCAYKRGWLPGIRQKGAADSSADKLLRKVAAHETHGCCLSNGTVAALSREGMFRASRKTPEESTKCFLLRAAVPFGQSPKRHQKRFFISRRQAGYALRRPRRRRIGWEGIYFSSCARDTAFGRTRQVSAKPKHCILERRVFTLA